MTDFFKKTEELLGEPFLGFKKDGGDWQSLIRAEQPESKRYSVIFSNTLTGVSGLIYDRKTGSKFFLEPPLKINEKFKVSDINLLDKKNSIAPKKEPLINKNISKILSSGEIKDQNDYLKKVGLDKFIDDSEPYFWRAVTNKKNEKAILAPYTSFDLFPGFIGGNLYLKDKKKFLKGCYQGCFAPHRLKEEYQSFVLCEGFREAFLAYSLIPDVNVLETGGLSKFKSIVIQILRLYKESRIFILGDNGSQNELNTLLKLSPNIKIAYPPEEKDFSDYFFKKKPTESSLIDIFLGKDIKNSKVTYKAIGVENNRMVIYSKFLNSVVRISPDKCDEVIRNVIKTSGWEGWKPQDKRVLVSHVWEDCVKAGVYQTNKIFGVGLYKTPKNDLIYNSGGNLYKVLKNKILKTSYLDHAYNDFLPVKTITDQPELKETEFESCLAALDDALCSFDFKKSHYGSLLLGFLVQSIYSGDLEFRPNLWIFSDEKSAGKSWTGNWIKQNLLPITKTSEGGASTIKGARQIMANNACLLHIDEIGERGTRFMNEALSLFEILRSATGGFNSVNLGTSEQNPIYQRLKFSSLLTVIEGKDLLKEQDENRCVFISLKSNSKENFRKTILPKLRKVEETKNLIGFLPYALTKYHIFKNHYSFFEDELSKYPIGHRVRGLAAILAGYSCLYNDTNKGIKLLNNFKESDPAQFEAYKTKEESEDFFMVLAHEVVSSNDLPFGEDSKLFIHAAMDGDFKKFGIKASEDISVLAININKASSLIKKVSKKNYDKAQLRHQLENSPHFIRKSRMRMGYGDEAIIVLLFNVKELL